MFYLCVKQKSKNLKGASGAFQRFTHGPLCVFFLLEVKHDKRG